MMTDWRTKTAFLAALLVSAFAVVALLLQWLPLGVEGSVVYFYRNPHELDMLSPLILFYGFVLCLLALLIPAVVYPRFKLKTPVLLLLLFALGVFIDLSLYRPFYFAWSARILCNASANGNPFLARGATVKDAMSYPEEHKAFAQKGYLQAVKEERRLTTYPPGLPLVYHGVLLLCQIPSNGVEELAKLALKEDVLGKGGDGWAKTSPENIYAASCASVLLCLLIAGLLPLFGYWLGLELSRDKELALFGAAALLLIPSLHLFNPLPDTLITLCWLLAACLCVRGLRLRAKVFTVLAGALIAFCCFLSFNSLALGFLCGLLGVAVLGPKDGLKSFLLLALPGVAMLVLLHLMNADLVSMFLQAMRNNAEFYGDSGRSLLASLPQNALELCLFGGAAITTAFVLCALFLAPSAWKEWRASRSLPLDKAFGVSLLVCLLFVTFGGGVRGEMARNCMALMPLTAVAFATCCGLDKRRVLILCICSAVFAVAMSALIEANILFRLVTPSAS